MAGKNKNTITFTVSDFYCGCCGTKGMPIPRKASRQREEGHLKKLYCLKCKKQTNHVEVRPFDYSLEELLQDIKLGKYKEEINNEN